MLILGAGQGTSWTSSQFIAGLTSNTINHCTTGLPAHTSVFCKTGCLASGQVLSINNVDYATVWTRCLQELPNTSITQIHFTNIQILQLNKTETIKSARWASCLAITASSYCSYFLDVIRPVFQFGHST